MKKLFLILCFSTFAHADISSRIQTEIQRMVLSPTFEDGNSLGMSALYFDENGVQDWSIGKTHLQLQKLPDVQTFFEIGSITKIFTTQILAQMEVEGFAHEKSRVSDFLPELKGYDAGKILLRDLARHRSGLPRVPESIAQYSDRYQPYMAYTPEEFWRDLKAFRSKKNHHAFVYSNWGIALLAKVLEKASNEPYSQLVQRRIFQPLKMLQTKLVLTRNDFRNVAHGHSSGLEPMSFWNMGLFEAAGGLKSTAGDLMRFAQAVIHSPLRRLGMTLDYQIRNDLGWMKTDKGTLWHNGGTGGFGSLLLVNPKEKRALVVLANTEQGLDDRCLITAFEGGECESFQGTPVHPEIAKKIPGCYAIDTKNFLDVRTVGRIVSMRFVGPLANQNGALAVYRRLYATSSPDIRLHERLKWISPELKEGFYLQAGTSLSLISFVESKERVIPLTIAKPENCPSDN